MCVKWEALLLPEAVPLAIIAWITISLEVVVLSEKSISNELVDSFTKSGGCLIFTTPTNQAVKAH